MKEFVKSEIYISILACLCIFITVAGMINSINQKKLITNNITAQNQEINKKDKINITKINTLTNNNSNTNSVSSNSKNQTFKSYRQIFIGKIGTQNDVVLELDFSKENYEESEDKLKITGNYFYLNHIKNIDEPIQKIKLSGYYDPSAKVNKIILEEIYNNQKNAEFQIFGASDKFDKQYTNQSLINLGGEWKNLDNGNLFKFTATTITQQTQQNTELFLEKKQGNQLFFYTYSKDKTTKHYLVSKLNNRTKDLEVGKWYKTNIITKYLQESEIIKLENDNLAPVISEIVEFELINTLEQTNN